MKRLRSAPQKISFGIFGLNASASKAFSQLFRGRAQHRHVHPGPPKTPLGNKNRAVIALVLRADSDLQRSRALSATATWVCKPGNLIGFTLIKRRTARAPCQPSRPCSMTPAGSARLRSACVMRQQARSPEDPHEFYRDRHAHGSAGGCYGPLMTRHRSAENKNSGNKPRHRPISS